MRQPQERSNLGAGSLLKQGFVNALSRVQTTQPSQPLRLLHPGEPALRVPLADGPGLGQRLRHPPSGTHQIGADQQPLDVVRFPVQLPFDFG
jgi:hypothetical protein